MERTASATPVFGKRPMQKAHDIFKFEKQN